MEEPQLPIRSELGPEASSAGTSFRFSVGSLMVFVLTTAAVSALFVKIYQFLYEWTKLWATDFTVVLFIMVMLSAIAIVTVQRGTLNQMMFEIALSCGLVLLTIAFLEAMMSHVLLYWVQAIFALTVVLPAVLRRFVSKARSDPVRDWVLWGSQILIGAFANIVLVLSGILLQWFVARLFDLN